MPTKMQLASLKKKVALIWAVLWAICLSSLLPSPLCADQAKEEVKKRLQPQALPNWRFTKDLNLDQIKPQFLKEIDLQNQRVQFRDLGVCLIPQSPHTSFGPAVSSSANAWSSDLGICHFFLQDVRAKMTTKFNF